MSLSLCRLSFSLKIYHLWWIGIYFRDLFVHVSLYLFLFFIYFHYNFLFLNLNPDNFLHIFFLTQSMTLFLSYIFSIFAIKKRIFPSKIFNVALQKYIPIEREYLEHAYSDELRLKDDVFIIVLLACLIFCHIFFIIVFYSIFFAFFFMSWVFGSIFRSRFSCKIDFENYISLLFDLEEEKLDQTYLFDLVFKIKQMWIFWMGLHITEIVSWFHNRRNKN